MRFPSFLRRLFPMSETGEYVSTAMKAAISHRNIPHLTLRLHMAHSSSRRAYASIPSTLDIRWVILTGTLVPFRGGLLLQPCSLPIHSFFVPPTLVVLFFFFNDTATTEIYTLSLHDALPI